MFKATNDTCSLPINQIRYLHSYQKRKRRLVRLFSFLNERMARNNDLRRRSLGWRLCAARGGSSKAAISAAAPLAGRSAQARPGNGTCGKADHVLPPQPPCPPEKDIGRTNLRAARLLRFLCPKFKCRKKDVPGCWYGFELPTPCFTGGICDVFRRSRLFLLS